MKRTSARSAATASKRSRAKWVTFLGAAIAAGAVLPLLAHTESAAPASPQSPASVIAGESSQSTARAQRRYRATRRVVVDSQTGLARMPTAREVEELVDTLATLTKRTTEGLPQSASPAGGTGVDLDGGFGGVMLARPNDDGTFETRCVFTFEAGAEFLGLVEDAQ